MSCLPLGRPANPSPVRLASMLSTRVLTSIYCHRSSSTLLSSSLKPDSCVLVWICPSFRRVHELTTALNSSGSEYLVLYRFRLHRSRPPRLHGLRNVLHRPSRAPQDLARRWHGNGILPFRTLFEPAHRAGARSLTKKICYPAFVGPCSALCDRRRSWQRRQIRRDRLHRAFRRQLRLELESGDETVCLSVFSISAVWRVV